MNKDGLNLARIATMSVFALSCFGLLTFLWITFGGPVPLQPKGYRVMIPFKQAGQLVEQADVRVSGVPIGKVVQIKPGKGLTDAVVQIKPEYAPVPSDMRATLRQKTLLGETYIELTPGTKTARKLPEDGTLSVGNVQQQVELDQVLQAFTPSTRKDLGTFLRGFGSAVDGRQQDISGVAGQAGPVAERASGVLGVLDQQHTAVRQLIVGGRGTFDIVARNDANIHTIVNQGGQVLSATAAVPKDLRATVRALPRLVTSLRGLSKAQRRLFPILGPAAERLVPTAELLPTTLDRANALAPQLGPLASGLNAVNAAAPKALPAAGQILAAARPALAQLDPLAGAITPVVRFVDLYKREVVSSFADVAASANASDVSSQTGQISRYLRILVPLDDQSLDTASTRTPLLRSNPYRAPGTLNDDPSTRTSFSCANTKNSGGTPEIGAGVPPCVEQQPFEVQGKTVRYPDLSPVVLHK